MDTNPYLWHPGAADAVVSCLYQRDFDRNLDVATRLGLGFLPPGRNATVDVFHSSLIIHAQEAIYQDDKGVEVAVMLEAGLQVIPLFLFFFRHETFLQRLVLLGEGVCIHDTHVLNIICPYLRESIYQDIPFLL